MRIIKTVALLCITLIAIIFALSNRTSILVDLFPFGPEIEMPLFLFFFIILIIGVVFGAIVSIKQQRKQLSLYRKQEQQIRSLETELTSLKLEHKILENK